MMRTPSDSLVIRALIVAMAASNAIFLTVNGMFMLVVPLAWYEFIPGVTDTGFFNQHFVRDIGLIQMFLGVAFGFGLAQPERRIALWTGATIWLCAHALFHLWEVAVGICSPSVIPRDFPAVSLPAINGALLTLWMLYRSRAGKTALA